MVRTCYALRFRKEIHIAKMCFWAIVKDASVTKKSVQIDIRMKNFGVRDGMHNSIQRIHWSSMNELTVTNGNCMLTLHEMDLMGIF